MVIGAEVERADIWRERDKRRGRECAGMRDREDRGKGGGEKRFQTR